jgi:peptide/nickel transport system permease protein
MLNYILRRLIQTLVLLFLVSLLAFSLVEIMPGDPASAVLGSGATQEEILELRDEMGLNEPFLERYGNWLWEVVHGNMGWSYTYRENISTLVAERLPITMYLASLAIILSVILGIPAGIFCAIRRNSFLDQIVSLTANIGISTPSFWLGILGILFFAMKLKWLPAQGWTSPLDDFVLSTKLAVMPVILLAIPGIAVLTRQMRSSMLEVIRQDYIRTAWSKGLTERMVVVRHSLKNGLIPVVTLLGLHLRVLVGGSVLVEQVFNIPGMGRLLVFAAFNKDFMVVQAGVLLIGAVVCVANLLVDISYGWIDPRIKYG